MLSAAVLLAPGCDAPGQPDAAHEGDPVRRASFRALAARDYLHSCPQGAVRPESERQHDRLAELKQLAAGKGAGRAIWLGENDWAGVARYSDRAPCGPGEPAYRQALAAFSATLDQLAAGIAGHRP